MNTMNTLTRQYKQFTPDERLRLTVAAIERKDLAEVDRLKDSCPQETRVLPDPRYMGRLLCLRSVVCTQIIRWTDVSANLLFYSQLVAWLPAEDVKLRAIAEARWKELSAVWRGIESGLSNFCADTGLTCDQLLALAGGRPMAVEMAGSMLHVKGRANGRCEATIRQELRKAWQVLSQQ